MQYYYLIYHFLIFIAVLLSVFLTVRRIEGVKYLAALFAITLGVELFFDNVKNSNISYMYIYHIYTPFYFLFFSLYFMQNLKNKQVLKILKGLNFLIFGILYSISFFFYRFNGYPSICINICGIMLVCLAIYSILTIDFNSQSSFFKTPITWFSLGIIVFFSTAIFVNTVYSSIAISNIRRAKELFQIIETVPLLFLYTSINIGLICLIPKMNYSSQQ